MKFEGFYVIGALYNTLMEYNNKEYCVPQLTFLGIETETGNRLRIYETVVTDNTLKFPTHKAATEYIKEKGLKKEPSVSKYMVVAVEEI